MNPKEKTRALECNESGKLPLADEELDNVAGGMDDADVRLHPIDLHVNICQSCKSADLIWNSDGNADYIYLCKKCGFKALPFIPANPPKRSEFK